MPTITLANGDNINFVNAISVIDIAKKINYKKAKDCIAGLINNKLVDASDIIYNDSTVEFITLKNDESINIIRQSCAHLLGYAIKLLWPKTKIAKTKIIENGFYCDFDLDYQLKLKDIDIIENNIYALIKKRIHFIKKTVTLNEAYKIFKNFNEIYRLKLLDKLIQKTNFINLYFQEKYVDMSIGPNVPNIKFCSNFKLQKISGAYWQNKNKNNMLQRIYGTAWNSKKKMNFYLNSLKEAKIRDHRKINKQLNLYHIQNESPGMIFWHNNGLIIFHELQSFIREKLRKYDYQEVKSPLLIDKSLWEKTGHWKYYKESMFITTSENKKYCIKPMNCPAHIQIFNQKLKSYKELPIRMAEFGSCHRNESSGSLHGLIRVRNFTQDDAHIFCTENQIKNEINLCIKMLYDIYNTFGFKKILVKLSTRPNKRIGSDAIWNSSELTLENTLKENNIKFKIQSGEGAFYGPKIEFILYDSLNRAWQCGTIQLDFSLPVVLKAEYINEKNLKKTPIMIHRAILGSIERFIGILIEEYNGFFPTWLAPIQVVVLNINKKQIQYTSKITDHLENFGFRVQSDLRNKKISFKIREYSLLHVPYMIICGEKEEQLKKISVRSCKGKNFICISVKKFIEKLSLEVNNKSIYQSEE